MKEKIYVITQNGRIFGYFLDRKEAEKFVENAQASDIADAVADDANYTCDDFATDNGWYGYEFHSDYYDVVWEIITTNSLEGWED